MAAEKIEPIDNLLKSVFGPKGWDTYAERAGLLSSADPRDWKSVDFPVEIALELTNYCNLRCVMCPVPGLGRARGFMDEGLFRKVVEDISEESGFLFLPQGFGEPLVHPQWSRFLDTAHIAGIRPIIVLTNGMLLDSDKIACLTERVDIVVVTIDGCKAETYESVRINGSFEKVTGNMECLLTERKAGIPHLILRMIRMKDTEEEIEGFKALWSGKISEGDIVQVSDCIDWAGTVPYRGVSDDRMQERRDPCRMLWKNLTVYHDGRVSPCCYDAEGDLIVGNALEQSLREIWNGKPLRNLRNLHLTRQSGKIALCSRCRNRH